MKRVKFRWIKNVFRSAISDKINFFKQLKEKTCISFSEYCWIKFSGNLENISIYGKKIKATNAFWHLHSINEIFLEDTYKFISDSSAPLIIDCGSNIGLSIIYFKKNYPDAKIIGFEPDIEICKILRDNLNQFNFSDIEINNAAIWINDDEQMFNALGNLSGGLQMQDTQQLTGIDRTFVKAVRLKNFIEKFDTIDLLKIDIEGAEVEVLKDCCNSLGIIKNLFVEFHRHRGNSMPLYETIKIIEDAGFTIYIKEAWNNLPIPFLYKNYSPHFDLQLNIFGVRH